MDAGVLAGEIVETFFARSHGANRAVRPGQRFHCGRFPDVEVCITRIGRGGWLDLVDMNTGLYLNTVDATDWDQMVQFFDLTPIDPTPENPSRQPAKAKQPRGSRGG